MTNDDSDNLISFRWNNHQTTFFEVLANLRANDIYTDVTLACEHQFVAAHKLVLSSCSDYFKEIFARAACISPVIVLKDIRITELDALIDYMYLGEADVKESDVAGVLRAAECLKIKGLGVPDEHSKYFSSPTSSAVEAEITSPIKKFKLEDKNQPVFPAIKDENKRKGMQLNFPYLTNALKLNDALMARRPKNGIKFSRSQFRNNSLRNKNSVLAKSNREIKVIALPSSGKEVGLMTLKMNDPISELNTKQLTADSLDNHSSNNLSSILDANDLNVISPVYNVNDSVSGYHNISSQFDTALPRNETNENFEKYVISSSEMCVTESRSKQETTDMEHGDLSSINTDASIEEIAIEISEGQNTVNQDEIMEEDESVKLKLPNFSSAVQPYLNGETISHKTRCRLRACIVEQLLSHFCDLDELMRKVPKFYFVLENLLIKMYPNIVEDKCKKRSGHLGSLISLMRCEYKKATKAKTS